MITSSNTLPAIALTSNELPPLPPPFNRLSTRQLSLYSGAELNRVLGTEKDRRYTLPYTLALINERTGVGSNEWDLDLCAEPGHSVAPDWRGVIAYGKNCAYFLDGLTPGWTITNQEETQPYRNVFCNPPFSKMRAAYERCLILVAYGTSGFAIDNLVFVTKSTDATNGWWQDLVEPVRDERALDTTRRLRQDNATLNYALLHYACYVHFLPGRPKYGTPSDPDGRRQASPPFGTAIIHWRSRRLGK